MIEYEPARQHLANSLQKLEVRRQALVREVADRLHLAAQGEDSPMAIHQIILECEPLGNLVRFDLEMAKERYNNIVQAAVDDIRRRLSELRSMAQPSPGSTTGSSTSWSIGCTSTVTVAVSLCPSGVSTV